MNKYQRAQLKEYWNHCVMFGQDAYLYDIQGIIGGFRRRIATLEHCLIMHIDHNGSIKYYNKDFKP